MTVSEIIECPDCYGQGQYLAEVGCCGFSNPSGREVLHHCDRCDGAGEIEKPEWYDEK